MSSNRTRVRKQGITMAITVACIVPLGGLHAGQFEVGEAVERDEELWEHLSDPHSEVRAGLGWLSDDAFMFGRYSGLTDDGLFPDLWFDLNFRPVHDADEMRYWRLQARNLGIDSRRIKGEYGLQGSYTTYFDFRQMPHNEWEAVNIEHEGAGSRELSSDTPRAFDIEQERQRFTLGGDVRFGENAGWRLQSDFSREDRDGTRLRGFERGFSAGAGSVAPAAVDYYTDEFNLTLEIPGRQFHGSAGYHFSAFTQDNGSGMEVDSDTFALEPENTFHRVSFAGNYRPNASSRLSGNAHFGTMLQDDGFVESGEDVLRNGSAVSSLDGEIRTTALNLRGNHRFTDRTRVRANFRYDDRDNRTDVFEVAGRETRPMSYTRTRLSADADHRLTRRTRLTGGVEREDRDRDFGDRRETDETTTHLQIQTRVGSSLSGGARAEYARQRGTTYDAERNNPVPEGLRNYDIADRDRNQIAVFGTYTPQALPTVSISARSRYLDDDYTDSALGRTGAEQWSTNLDVGWTPMDDLSLYGTLGWDKGDINLAADDWTAEQAREVLSTGVGAEWTVRPDELDLGIDVTRMDSRLRMDFDNDDPRRHPTLESGFTEFALHGTYQRSLNLSFQGRYLYQRFSETDWALGEEFVTATPQERDYSVHMVLFSMTHQF